MAVLVVELAVEDDRANAVSVGDAVKRAVNIPASLSLTTGGFAEVKGVGLGPVKSGPTRESVSLD